MKKRAKTVHKLYFNDLAYLFLLQKPVFSYVAQNSWIWDALCPRKRIFDEVE